MKERRHRASFTIEAAMVLSIVIFSVAGLIGHAYRLHDTVTGSMILEEALIKARGTQENQEKNMEERVEQYGETLGNPRLWLGKYELYAEIEKELVSGKAMAGTWEQEMELGRFMPGTFIRRYEAIREIGEELANDGSGIPAGDESKLYGDPAGDNGQ